MKTFLVEHNGLYLGGLSVVTAKDILTAKKILRPMVREEMKRLGMKGKITMDLTEINTKKANDFMVNNGDY